MTNEQLATFIHAGGNDELIPLLWDKVQSFVYYKARSVYNMNTVCCKRRGVELWDIQQVNAAALNYGTYSKRAILHFWKRSKDINPRQDINL